MQQRLEDQTAERLAELEQTRSQNCERAREQFQLFTTYARIRVEDEGGGTRVLTEEERQERIAEAREAIVLNCEDEG
jgi:arginyl-tRNA--protein-N-Asp/Glu arginylyltransferase